MVIPIISAFIRMLRDEDDESKKEPSLRHSLSRLIAFVVMAFIGLIGIGIIDFLMLRLL